MDELRKERAQVHAHTHTRVYMQYTHTHTHTQIDAQISDLELRGMLVAHEADSRRTFDDSRQVFREMFTNLMSRSRPASSRPVSE